MLNEINLLDWLFAAGQGLFAASLFYFLYLVVRFSRPATLILGRIGPAPGAVRAPVRRNEIYSYSVE